MMLHQLAETYSLLPSEVMERATTFDMVILDIVTTYKNTLEERARTGHRDPSSYSIDDLMKIKEMNSAPSKKG